MRLQCHERHFYIPYKVFCTFRINNLVNRKDKIKTNQDHCEIYCLANTSHKRQIHSIIAHTQYFTKVL